MESGWRSWARWRRQHGSAALSPLLAQIGAIDVAADAASAVNHDWSVGVGVLWQEGRRQWCRMRCRLSQQQQRRRRQVARLHGSHPPTSRRGGTSTGSASVGVSWKLSCRRYRQYHAGGDDSASQAKAVAWGKGMTAGAGAAAACLSSPACPTWHRLPPCRRDTALPCPAGIPRYPPPAAAPRPQSAPRPTRSCCARPAPAASRPFAAPH